MQQRWKLIVLGLGLSALVGSWPGALFGVHGISVDQEQNLYLAAVGRGGVQKFAPRAGANPAYLVGKPVYSAWK